MIAFRLPDRACKRPLCLYAALAALLEDEDVLVAAAAVPAKQRRHKRNRHHASDPATPVASEQARRLCGD